jgi:hypothetical protein
MKGPFVATKPKRDNFCVFAKKKRITALKKNHTRGKGGLYAAFVEQAGAQD